VIADPVGAAAKATWRLAEFETDGRLLFCRAIAGQVARVAMVDGSVVRTSPSTGRRTFQLALPRVVPDVHVDLRAGARIAGPLFGAKLVVSGQEQPVSVERRSTVRAHRSEA
jgi:hypothetical protein